MRPLTIRLAIIVLVLTAAVGMTATASQSTTALDITITSPSDLTPTPTPSPARERPNAASVQPPTVIEPGRIYEGNLFGTDAKFLLNAELGQFFTIEVTTEAFDAVIEVLDASGTQVGRDDDSGAGNMPQLIFIAPSTGQFTVIVKGYSDPVEGSYVLHVNNSVQALEYGVPVTVTQDGTTSSTFSFEAQRGDVINLYASSGDTIDTTLKLLGPDGLEVSYVDDYSGVDPEFRRLPLGEAGHYFVIHAPYSTSAVGDVTLTLEKTEIGVISADPTRLTLNESSVKDVFNFEITEGRLYVVTVSTTALSYGTLDITDIDATNFGSVSFSNSQGGSLFFRASFTGTARVTVSVTDSSGSLPIDAFISVRATDG